MVLNYGATAKNGIPARSAGEGRPNNQALNEAVAFWRDPAFVRGQSVEERAQSELLREMFENPFRTVALTPNWRTSTVVHLAQQMYDSRDFAMMPILADVLQDASCEHEDVLNHCRDPHAAHVRGCWVVDLVLGKS